MLKRNSTNQTYLCHHGIKGQKWGVRRFQNEDGTLSEAGRARYNTDGSKKKTEQMTNKELSEANQRLQLERQYNSLMGNNYKNRGSNKDIAIRAGASAVGSALLTFGGFTLKEYAKNSYRGKETLKTAGTLALLAAGVGAISSVATSLGGQTTRENIGDQGGKKGKK